MLHPVPLTSATTEHAVGHSRSHQLTNQAAPNSTPFLSAPSPPHILSQQVRSGDLRRPAVTRKPLQRTANCVNPMSQSRDPAFKLSNPNGCNPDSHTLTLALMVTHTPPHFLTPAP